MSAQPGNTKGGSITVLMTSCLTGLDKSVLQIKTKNVSCHTADSKPVKQEVNCTVILPPLVFPGSTVLSSLHFKFQPRSRSAWCYFRWSWRLRRTWSHSTTFCPSSSDDRRSQWIQHLPTNRVTAWNFSIQLLSCLRDGLCEIQFSTHCFINFAKAVTNKQECFSGHCNIFE